MGLPGAAGAFFRELFYIQDDHMMAVTVSTRPGFRMGTPRRLFRCVLPGLGVQRNYDVAADGQRFAFVEPENPTDPPLIRVVQNWTALIDGGER